MEDYDVVVIGAGPGGYVAAIRAAQLGMKTAIVERDGVGGVCLNWGCIPTKSLLRNAEVLSLVGKAEDFGITFDNLNVDFGKAIDRSRVVVGKLTRGIEMLLRKNHVEVIKGQAEITEHKRVTIQDSGLVLNAKNIIIATGARERELPNLPVDKEIVITSREALELREVPDKIVIVGGGATGAEFAYLYRTYGAEVTMVELLPQILPQEDQETSKTLLRSFTRQGIEVITGSAVDDVSIDEERASVNITTSGETRLIQADKVLVAVGVKGNIDGLGLDIIGVETQRGNVVVGDTLETNVPSVYAVGDVTGKMLLAHVASAQGVTAVEGIAGLNPPKLNYSLMPRAVYCKPQVASFGLTETQAKEQGFDVRIGHFPFSASGKALALAETDGMIKLVVDSEIGEILGAHMVGSEVTELLGEVAMTKLLEGTTAELGWLVHPHPTISEMLKEAALNVDGESIHI